MSEFKQLTTNPPEGVIAGPVSEENYFHWEAAITGPEGTPFEVWANFPYSLLYLSIDPRGQPTITAGSDHYFHTHVVRLYVVFQNLAKQNFQVRKSDYYWLEYGSGRARIMTHVL